MDSSASYHTCTSADICYNNTPPNTTDKNGSEEDSEDSTTLGKKRVDFSDNNNETKATCNVSSFILFVITAILVLIFNL